jgi:hypothetical protein
VYILIDWTTKEMPAQLTLNKARKYLDEGDECLKEDKCMEAVKSLLEASRLAFLELALHLKLHLHGDKGIGVFMAMLTNQVFIILSTY